jgi:hypothetical protein
LSELPRHPALSLGPPARGAPRTPSCMRAPFWGSEGARDVGGIACAWATELYRNGTDVLLSLPP